MAPVGKRYGIDARVGVGQFRQFHVAPGESTVLDQTSEILLAPFVRLEELEDVVGVDEDGRLDGAESLFRRLRGPIFFRSWPRLLINSK